MSMPERIHYTCKFSIFRKPSECCTGGRFDDCSVPIFDTYCYCDDFCLQKDPSVSLHDDCCPDFREVCLGQKTPDQLYDRPANDQPSVAECEHQGARVPVGGTLTINCNKCMCREGLQLDCEQDVCMVEEEVVQRVNGDQFRYGWMATNYTKFWGRKAKDGLMLKTGTLTPDARTLRMLPVRLSPVRSLIPRLFDARRKPEWRGRISGVQDQEWCGASWAFSTIGVAQDRLSIVAHGLNPVQLSPQNLLSCGHLLQKGCEGGHIELAWSYLRRNGVVEEECYRYESGRSGTLPSCLIHRGDTSRLPCQMGHLYKTEPAYRISSMEEDIQWEILSSGPVQAVMMVQPSLFMYQSGVYSCSHEDKIESAMHSVRILGWGEDSSPGHHPTKYWLVANSWGSDWGEGGLFRIRRGTNECGIESFVLAARARMANLVYGNS